MSTSVRARRVHLVAAAGLGAALALSACSGSADTASAEPTGDAADAEITYPVTVDDCGTDVTFEAAPESVMTIGSDAIALLDAAGAADRIVARSGEFGAELPADLTDPPTDADIVDPSDPTTEQIIGSGADVVIGYGFFNADPATLAESGIATLTVSGECGHDGGASAQGVTFDTVLGDIERFGQVFGTSPTAQESVDALGARIDDAGAPSDAAERTAAAVYYFSTSSPLSAYGGGGILQQMLASTGLENAYGDQTEVYLDISVESLLEADPDVIVLVHGLHGESFDEAKARFLAEPGVADLQAVAADRIIGLTGAETSASPAAVTGLESLQQAVTELD